MDKVTRFKLAREATGTRNQADSFEESKLAEEARKAREVLLPGVDMVTALTMHVRLLGPSGRPVVDYKELSVPGMEFAQMVRLHQRDPAELQLQIDTALVSKGYAVFMHESWKHLHHVVRYYELIEKNEAPDTSLLEWLVTMGVVRPRRARNAARHFSEHLVKVGRTKFMLDEDDAERLKMAAQAREQIEKEEAELRIAERAADAAAESPAAETNGE